MFWSREHGVGIRNDKGEVMLAACKHIHNSLSIIVGGENLVGDKVGEEEDAKFMWQGNFRR